MFLEFFHSIIFLYKTMQMEGRKYIFLSQKEIPEEGRDGERLVLSFKKRISKRSSWHIGVKNLDLEQLALRGTDLL